MNGVANLLFRRDTLDQIATGKVTLAFRRWAVPTLRAGFAIRTPAGVLAIDKVEKVTPAQIKDKDARSAGYKSRASLMAELGKEPGDIYRIGFRLAGPDPLIALRKEAKLTKKEMKSVIAALNRLDHESPSGAWTRTILRLIDKYPARRIPDLAASIGRDPMIFKREVRKLKELGLVDNLEVGHRLSPRGRIVVVEIASLESLTY